MSRLVEVVAPARLGPGFRWLLAAGLLSKLGDGLVIGSGVGGVLARDAPRHTRGRLAGLLSSAAPCVCFLADAGPSRRRVDAGRGHKRAPLPEWATTGPGQPSSSQTPT